MGHRTTYAMARSVARRLARHLTPTVARQGNIEAATNSVTTNNLRESIITIDSHLWVIP